VLLKVQKRITTRTRNLVDPLEGRTRPIVNISGPIE